MNPGSEARLVELLSDRMGERFGVNDLAEILGEPQREVLGTLTAMRERGYRLSVRGGSARLDELTDVFDCAMTRFMLKKYGTDCGVEMREVTESTNADAKLLCAKGFSGIVASARQTGGRGRNGKSFFSPPGGVYFSVVRNMSGADGGELIKHVLVTGVAVCRAIEELGFSPKLKWPNDVYLGSGKLCGILCETVAAPRGKFMINGIGINVNTENFSGLPDIATSLYIAGGRRFLRSEVLAAVCKQLSDIGVDEAMAAYSKYSNTIGRRIVVDDGRRRYEAVATGIDENGFLLVEYGGLEGRIVTGDVSVRLT